ncbi:hypothetical protein C5167_026842 [Papaver somniferum]|nr:hypothetical protein C5167_026842 [Papaver somniferum]
MLDQGILPTTITFTILIDSLCKYGNIDDAVGVFRYMEKLNIKPDRITYNSMINGLCLAGRLQDAAELFDSMVDRGLEPNAVSCTTLIDGYCRNCKLDEAMLLFNKMKQNGLKPTTLTYSILLAGLYRGGRIKVAEVLDRICKNGKIEELHPLDPVLRQPWPNSFTEYLVAATAFLRGYSMFLPKTCRRRYKKNGLLH